MFGVCKIPWEGKELPVYLPRTDAVSLIQSKLEQKLGPQRYKVWFKNSTQIIMADGHLKVSAPNAFICGWIERHFAEVIAATAQEVTGREMQVSFTVEPKLLQALRKRQLDSQAEFIAKNPERVAREARRAGHDIPARKLRGRFEDLVIGPANRLAASAIRSIVDGATDSYSPIFIHGGSGLGKTHLLHALANELTAKRPDCRWAYLTGDEFTNAYVLAVRSNGMEAFRQRYRNLDVLIIDDVHFLASKKATQEEFLHTFNAIDAQRKHVVLASDSHPKLIGQFSEQLINRFVAGMVVRVEAPDFEMRCQILRRRATAVTTKPVPDDVIAYIAQSLSANVRELEGALLKLVMFSTVSHQPITLSLARQALSEHLHRTQRVLGLEEIDQTVAMYFGLTPADLHTSRKTRTIALARGIAMYLARKHTDMSFPEIGRFMGNKNHSTVILANRRIEEMIAADEVARRQTPAGMQEEKLRDLIAKIEKQLGKAAAPEHAHVAHVVFPDSAAGTTLPIAATA
jgi:chromosomal replication initiator protein